MKKIFGILIMILLFSIGVMATSQNNNKCFWETNNPTINEGNSAPQYIDFNGPIFSKFIQQPIWDRVSAERILLAYKITDIEQLSNRIIIRIDKHKQSGTDYRNNTKQFNDLNCRLVRHRCLYSMGCINNFGGWIY
jgi:hypothetical protein